jgi:hypothetical protein
LAKRAGQAAATRSASRGERIETVSEAEGGIEVVRGRLAPEVGDELVGFWSEQGALSEPAARQRLAEVVCILRDPEGRIAGANSAYPDRVDAVGGRRFWIYRSFLRPDQIGRGDEMIEAAFAALDEEFRATGEGLVGVCVLIADREQMRRRPEAVWPGTSFIYAGHTPAGAEIRIAYFEGATIAPGEGAVMGDPTLEAGCRIVRFADQDEVSEEDVIGLWAREGVVAAAEARRRVHEVLLVAIDDEDGLAGVSTAYLQRNPQLDIHLWYYRAFVAAAHRKGNIAVQLALRGRDHLEERFVSGADTRGAGVAYEVENEGLKRYFNQALWFPTLLTFIGESPGGAHVRIRYFPGARAPAPAG